MVLLATSTLALTPATRCTGRTSRLSRTRLASSTLAPPEAAEDVLPLDVGERQALSVTERLGRSLTFYSRVLPILARYKLAELDLEQRCADEEECAAEYSELDEWGSDKLRDAILELQGFYVKSGQVLSTRVDLFAKPYCDKLQVLQEGLAPIPTDVVKEVVRRELCGDGDLAELFSDFEETPLGCASIAQVHAELIAESIKGLTGALPSWSMITLVMIVTMCLSDIINNAATAFIMAPIAVGISGTLGLQPDPFLMAVAVGASCAFLTPIGHQCNAMILGPGGYRFGDYWRVGLPLEIVIAILGTPLIIQFWPL